MHLQLSEDLLPLQQKLVLRGDVDAPEVEQLLLLLLRQVQSCEDVDPQPLLCVRAELGAVKVEDRPHASWVEQRLQEDMLAGLVREAQDVSLVLLVRMPRQHCAQFLHVHLQQSTRRKKISRLTSISRGWTHLQLVETAVHMMQRCGLP